MKERSESGRTLIWRAFETRLGVVAPGTILFARFKSAHLFRPKKEKELAAPAVGALAKGVASLTEE